MANFTPTKHDASTINGGIQLENGNIPQKEAFNNTIENSLYAVQQSDEAMRKVKEFEETEPLAKGTVVFENGQAQVNWDADKKASIEQVNSLSMCPSETAVNVTILNKNFTAPANGYLYLESNDRFNLGTSGMWVGSTPDATTPNLHIGYFPCIKNAKYMIQTDGTLSYSRFIYAKEV